MNIKDIIRYGEELKEAIMDEVTDFMSQKDIDKIDPFVDMAFKEYENKVKEWGADHVG